MKQLFRKKLLTELMFSDKRSAILGYDNLQLIYAAQSTIYIDIISL